MANNNEPQRHSPAYTAYLRVLEDPNYFYDTIMPEFNRILGEDFKIPKVNGQEIDFHQAFVDVTSECGMPERTPDAISLGLAMTLAYISNFISEVNSHNLPSTSFAGSASSEVTEGQTISSPDGDEVSSDALRSQKERRKRQKVQVD